MSEEIIPDVKMAAEAPVEKASDVVEGAEVAAQAAADAVEEVVETVSEEAAPAEVTEEVAPAVEEPVLNLAAMSLAELSAAFEALLTDEERMKKFKDAEAIKAAFYKKLSKEKADAGLSASVEEPSADEVVEETPVETEAPETLRSDPFEAIEAGFKSLYNKYKKERAEFNRTQEKEREENLVKKQAVIDDLKALVEKQEDVSATFPEFRALQARWREIGPVPVQNFRNINDTYQFYVEQFYDKVQINRDMRDLDFKKNLQAKEKFCEEAERLAEKENVVEAFRELQKLHEQWKEYGPVAKEFRESIWDRFKAATAIINKKYQGYFEGMKEKQAENLVAKTGLCEQVEAIAAREEIKTSNEWNSLSKQIEEIQKQWRSIGFASKKENQKIYDRFRAACDKFYERKRLFYADFKDSMNVNMEKKLAIIEQAEALKSSTEWKKAADQFISLQKQWKEIGAVPRKKSEQLWKRFRAACDEFFAERDKHAKPENDFYGNLKAKKALIEEIKAYVLSGEEADVQAMQDFMARYQSIGFVPFKEKDAVAQAYREAMGDKFPEFTTRRGTGRGPAPRGGSPERAPRTEKDRLVQKYTKLQQDIDTYENNIGFFAMSKNSEPLIRQMQERIVQAKQELKELEDKIRSMESSEQPE